MTNSGALDAWEWVWPMQPPPATVQAAVPFEPRRRSLTPRSIAFVSLAAVPAHEAEPAGQLLSALECETLTGPETYTGPCAVITGSERFCTSVSVSAVQLPPAPRVPQDVVPTLSRYGTSPDAEPVVALLARPEHTAVWQATEACASLHATSGPVSPVVVVFSVSPAGAGAVPWAARMLVTAARAADSALRSASQASAAVGSWLLLTREMESDTQPVALDSQLDVPVVSRTGARVPSAATPWARV